MFSGSREDAKVVTQTQAPDPLTDAQIEAFFEKMGLSSEEERARFSMLAGLAESAPRYQFITRLSASSTP